MLYFRGSDYKISGGSTWYDGMDKLLMALGLLRVKRIPTFSSRVKVEDQ